MKWVWSNKKNNLSTFNLFFYFPSLFISFYFSFVFSFPRIFREPNIALRIRNILFGTKPLSFWKFFHNHCLFNLFSYVHCSTLIPFVPSNWYTSKSTVTNSIIHLMLQDKDERKGKKNIRTKENIQF